MRLFLRRRSRRRHLYFTRERIEVSLDAISSRLAPRCEPLTCVGSHPAHVLSVSLRHEGVVGRLVSHGVLASEIRGFEVCAQRLAVDLELLIKDMNEKMKMPDDSARKKKNRMKSDANSGNFESFLKFSRGFIEVIRKYLECNLC